MVNNLGVPLIIGFFLDLLLGDPLWLPHPVRVIGNLIFFGEKKMNSGKFRVWKGAALTLILAGGCWIILWGLVIWLRPYLFLSTSLMSVAVFYGMANRSLISEVWNVNRVLDSKGITQGRLRLSFIVGRETQNLTQNQVRTASLETLAENLSDGVIAPLFYYALGGIPLMFAYKAVNTLDSMIGYKNDRYNLFGRFAARTDDFLNFLPSRITALLMVFVSMSWRGFIFVFRYGHKHSSPNSGYPEAALAGILNCRFGGPNVYHGVLVHKPFIGECETDITRRMVLKACLVNMAVTVLFILMLLLWWTYF